MAYRFLKPLLFKIPPEKSHHITLASLNFMHSLGVLKPLFPQVDQPKRLWSLHFKNPVGLAAGLDKNGDYIDALAALGFGFIEIGTVTPKPQAGNPLPRLFRLPRHQALINRMGFNNKGIDYLIHQVKNAKYQGVLGINIGKNATTPLEKAIEDYRVCLQKAYPWASYITVNISSPNTLGLRNLQQGHFLETLLENLKTAQKQLARQHKKQVPMLIKIAPDLTEIEILELCQAFKRFEIDGVIATNTTVDRSPLAHTEYARETGGLSGLPLHTKSTAMLSLLKQELGNTLPIIASGGIVSSETAQEKWTAGADLIQLYTGLIYQGPRLIKECLPSG